jgi:hypothetical protein
VKKGREGGVVEIYRLNGRTKRDMYRLKGEGEKRERIRYRYK